MRCAVLLVSSGAGTGAVTPSCCSTASQRHCKCRARRRGPPAVAAAPRAPSSRAAAGQAAWRPTLQLTSSAMAAGRRGKVSLTRHAFFFVRRLTHQRTTPRQGRALLLRAPPASRHPEVRRKAQRKQPPLHRYAGLRPGSPLLPLRCRRSTRNGCAWRSVVLRRRRRRHRSALHARRGGLQAGLWSLRSSRRSRAPAPLCRRSRAPSARRDRVRGGLARGREACRCVAHASRTLIDWQCTFWHRRGRPAAPRARSRGHTAARSAACSARGFGLRKPA